jgi:hypothetical protein
MSFQPLDLPSLLRAALWPTIVVIALVIFRRQLPDLVRILSQRINKFSFAGLSLGLAVLPEMRSAAIEIEVRRLDAAQPAESGVSSIGGLFGELERGEGAYIVIDLGSESDRRWLTSRLYLLAFLIIFIERQIYLVFVETAGGLRKHFVGTASSNSIRRCLARHYGWLEAKMAEAYGAIIGSLQLDLTVVRLAAPQVTDLINQYLDNIRKPEPAPDSEEWVALNDGMVEHARWLDGARIERLLGHDLNTSNVVLMPNQSIDSLGESILSQQGSVVAILEMDRTFRGFADRSATLESLGSAFLKQRRSEDQTLAGR